MRKPERRKRYEGFSLEQIARVLADDMDEIEAVVDEHIEEDMAAHREAARVFQEWKLTSLRSQNRMLFAGIVLLLTSLLSIIVSVALQ